jgi:hypothetical protein
MNVLANDLLLPFATKYIWWKSPADALRYPAHIIAQVMNIGTYQDVQQLRQSVNDQTLIDVLNNAEAGQFSPKSWHYWHYRLGLAELEQVPPLPVRQFK